MQLVVSSTDPKILEAAYAACQILGITRVFVRGVETRSLVDAQPTTYASAVLGAHNRALAVRREHADVWAVGIEHLLLYANHPPAGQLMPIVYVMRQPDNQSRYANGSGVHVPFDLIRMASEIGFNRINIAMALRHQHGGQVRDVYAHLSADLLGTRDIVAEAIRNAIAPILHASPQG